MSSADDLLNDLTEIAAQPKPVPRPALPAPEPLSAMDQLLAKVPSGLVNNPATSAARNFVTAAASPEVGLAQDFANLLPNSTGVPQLYNRKVAEMLRANRDAEATSGPVVSTVNELAGGAAAPTNLALGGNAVPAQSVGMRAGQGGIFGAVGGLLSPVEVGPNDRFWGPKAAQMGIGTAGGAILSPLMGFIGDKVGALINRRSFNPADAAKQADTVLSQAASEAGQKLEDLPTEQVDSLRQQVVKALSEGKQIDAAAALRLADFKAEGIAPTLGEITRDPMQWAAEQNVKGVTGVGGPLTARLATGNKAVMSRIGQFGADAQETPVASAQLAAALRTFDQGQGAAVTGAYNTARQSAGKDLEIPLQGLAQDYARVVDDFGDKVPAAVRAKFSSYGLDPASPANQQKLFTFGEAEKLLQNINDHVGGDAATNRALGRLRDAVKSATTSVDVAGGPFAPARQAAAQRFATLDEVPAIQAATEGNANDAFVQKYVINNQSTEQVQRLAAILREQSPETYQQVRAQIGSHLGRAAFGENVAGDKPIAQERFNAAIRNLGTGKLEAFFSPDEVAQMKRLGRIGAYQQQPPAGSASNFSNTASALANLVRSLKIIPLAGKTAQLGGDVLERNAAMNPKVPMQANLTPDQRLLLARLLGAGSVGLGVGLGGVPGKQP